MAEVVVNALMHKYVQYCPLLHKMRTDVNEKSLKRPQGEAHTHKYIPVCEFPLKAPHIA